MRAFRHTTQHARTIFAQYRTVPSRINNKAYLLRFNRAVSSSTQSSIFKALSQHDPSSLAVVHSASGRKFTYGSLFRDVAATKELVGSRIGAGQGQRVAFLAENGYDYVVMFLSILAHDAVAVPLSHTFPDSEIGYIIDNSDPALILTTTKFEEKIQSVLRMGLKQPIVLNTLRVDNLRGDPLPEKPIRLENGDLSSGGLMLYTSGTTNRPKGVVLPTSVITAQAQSLVEAWKYSPTDRLLHVLPLHHIHGTINALFTPLFAGSSIEFSYPFNATEVWKRFASPFIETKTVNSESKNHAVENLTPDERKPPITFFTVVPTIYSSLINTFPTLNAAEQKAAKQAISPQNLRLNISGSAALPTPLKAAWTELSGGNTLLERYGMTEVGMALSCGLDFKDRVDASVGWPLPSVEVRLVDIDTNEVILRGEEKTPAGKIREGEIQLRGPTIFTEYWNNPKATADEFVEDTDGRGKWFKTGDVATRQNVPGTGQSDQHWAKGPMYFIRGRKSVDIIKIAGEKVSALEVERELLSLPFIAEAAVLGLPSEKWGQKIAAVVVLTKEGKIAGKDGTGFGAMDLRRALRERLAIYKIPRVVRIVEEIPRNAMGKVNKKGLARELFG